MTCSNLSEHDQSIVQKMILEVPNNDGMFICVFIVTLAEDIDFLTFKSHTWYFFGPIPLKLSESQITEGFQSLQNLHPRHIDFATE